MHDVFPTLALDTRPQPASVQRALMQGVTLYEPFGGLCAGLEATLRNGIIVRRYLYSDISLPAQHVARHRLTQLHQRYPTLFPTTACTDTFTALPMDVAQVTPEALVQAGALQGRQWMVVAGPECQDFSPTGGNKGVTGRHSQTLRHCISIIGALQQLQPAAPPLYVVENAAM